MSGYEPQWHLTGKPYAVQLEALRRSHEHGKYAYFLEQGMGKSAIWLNEWVEQFSDIDTCIILSPNSFKQDWAAAPSEWGLNVKSHVWPYDEFTLGKKGELNLFCMNYEAVRGSGFAHVSKMMDKRPCALIVDESTAIKNYKSQTARAVLDLSKRAKVVRLLNGTPMGNNVLDLYPQLRTIGELNGVNPYVFRNRYAIQGGWMGKQIIGVKNEEELHKILEGCSFRALKSDWLDLPPKISISVQLEMTPNQHKHYSEMLRDFCTLVSGHEYTAQMVISRLEKLRQISSGILIDGGKFTLIDPPENNPKIKAFFDIYESGPGKVVLVHYYSKIGHILLEQLEKLNPAFLRGGMKPSEIAFQKAKFNTDPSCRVLVAQITASSRAHTLLGGEGDDRANRMVFHDLTFSLTDKEQVNDRIHRGVQDKTCLYYHLLLSPVDKAQLAALEKKGEMVDLVVNVVKAHNEEK